MDIKAKSVREFHEKQGYPLDVPLSSVGNSLLEYVANEAHLLAKACEKPGLDQQAAGDPRVYRIHLILEEVSELASAMNVGSEEETADACADLEYVTVGTGETFAIPTDNVFDEVHRSNMTKKVRNLADDPRLRDKGASYKRPAIREAIESGRHLRGWKTHENV